MDTSLTLDSRLKACGDHISAAEQRVARFFLKNPEEVLIASASALAEQTGTSDATVVRTARTLGFAGMEELRRALARELRENLSPASRMARTLSVVSDDPDSALNITLDIHQKSLDDLRHDITPDQFQSAIDLIVAAQRTFVFGIGPSSAMAEYFAIQLGRFGLDAASLTQTGLLLADGVQKIRNRDLLVIFAYGRVYRELTVLLDQADRRGAARILFSDSLGPRLRSRFDLVLPVARGRADMLSMHTATLALVEALLVGVAMERPQETIANLETLNRIRAELAGKTMSLPAS